MFGSMREGMVETIITRSGLGKRDRFLDIGSGIGQVSRLAGLFVYGFSHLEYIDLTISFLLCFCCDCANLLI